MTEINTVNSASYNPAKCCAYGCIYRIIASGKVDVKYLSVNAESSGQTSMRGIRRVQSGSGGKVDREGRPERETEVLVGDT